MKRKLLNSMRVLLVAAGLCVGANAWAGETTTLLEYGTNDVAWTTEGLATWTAGGTPTITGGYVHISGGNGSYETSKTISPTSNVIINVTAVWRGRSDTGRAFSAGNGSYFRFGNIVVAQNDQDQKHGYIFTGLDNIASVTTFTAGSYRENNTSGTWLLIEAEINTATNKLTSFTIKSENGATTYVTQTDVSLTSADYTTVAFGYKKTGSVGNTNFEDLKSIKITQTTQDASVRDYTINYKYGDATIKSVADVAVEGSTVYAESPITIDAVKYYAADAATTSMEITSGTNVLNVELRLANTWGYKISTSTGVDLVTGTGTEGESYTVGYPEFYLDGTDLYQVDKYDGSKKEYRATFTLDSDDKTVTITATKKKEHVVFYSEGEDISGVTVNISGTNVATRASNAAAASLPVGGVTVTSLPAGTYKIFLGAHHTSNNANVTTAFTCGANNINIATTGTNQVTTTSEEFTIAATTDLVCSSITGNGLLDFVAVIDVNAEIAAAIAAAVTDCKAYDTTPAFATAIDAETFASAAEVYAFNTAYHITNGVVTDGVRDITGVIRNAGVSSTSNWTDSRVIELASEVSNVAPDNFLIDAYNQKLNTYQIIYNLPAGKYIVKAATRATETCGTGKIYVYAEGQVDKNAEGNHVGNTGGDLDHGWSWTSIDFELTAASDVKLGYYVDATSSKWASCDDWHIYKVETVSKTITSAGWATYCSPYALDFSSPIANLDAAYIVKGGDGSVLTKTEVTGTVPANTGLLLKGEGECVIPVVASGDAANVSGNKLVGVTAEYNLAKDGGYVLLNDATNGIGFYKNPSAAFTVGANTAYLPSGFDSGFAPAFYSLFDSETTSVGASLVNSERVNNEVFNLAGQRVSQPTKGLYIVGGRKVMVK